MCCTWQKCARTFWSHKESWDCRKEACVVLVMKRSRSVCWDCFLWKCLLCLVYTPALCIHICAWVYAPLLCILCAHFLFLRISVVAPAGRASWDSQIKGSPLQMKEPSSNSAWVSPQKLQEKKWICRHGTDETPPHTQPLHQMPHVRKCPPGLASFYKTPSFFCHLFTGAKMIDMFNYQQL